MKTALPVCFALGFCAAVQAADLPAAPISPPASKPAPAAAKAPALKLDLRVGSVRNYMMPRDFVASLNAPDPDKTEIVVEGQRELVPMKFEQPIPSGMPLLPLWWAATHPSRSWRILVPDLNAPPDGPTWDKVPPPIFRWGP